MQKQMENTTHTTPYSPKDSHTLPSYLHRANSQSRIRVYSNPKPVSSRKDSIMSKDWMCKKLGTESGSLPMGESFGSRGYRLTLVSSLPTSKKIGIGCS